MTQFEKAFEEIGRLVKTFHDNLHTYTSPKYQEAEVRNDFINKFFIALGWDVNHNQQTNPYEQEVKVEKGQKQHEATAQKRADYAFYLAPNFKDVQFFVEAKKPAVGLKNETHYFQTIRYGWNAQTPVAVLTDFEEFHILDCRIKPDLKNIFGGHHKQYRFTDYANKEKFAEIYWLFSREAVANKSIVRYAEAMPMAKGKGAKTVATAKFQAIDDSFLEYIDSIREEIAKAFKRNNTELDSEALTEAVQKTVDRLVFIRFLEDKLIETENHVSEWKSWKDFINDCRRLDAKYNGIVFKKHFIDELDFLGADEKHFLSICADMSSRNSPYDFNYIPIHILGSIYERFLGKVVRATDKRVFIEEKPEVRKAGGVYYTPKYIVDYIVQNTVGKLIENKTPKEIALLRFADIACGSGSFLIGVYDCLLEYHKKYYAEKLEGKTEIDKRSEDFGHTEYRDGAWALTLKLKQEILQNNIYGVDIDHQAVEVTQLSLFLKMLEDETLSTTQVRQGSMFSKVLPDLSKNIICGNSLIGWDIMHGQASLSFGEGRKGEAALKKLNPMDYEAVFPAIMRNGGFDAIVGNPPYVMGTSNIEKKYFEKFKFQTGKPDLYRLFIERCLNIINKHGLLSYIIPNSLLTIPAAKDLRKELIINNGLFEVINFWKNVFKGVGVNSIIITCKRKYSSDNISIINIHERAFCLEDLQFSGRNQFSLPKKLLNEKNTFSINVQFNEKEDNIISKIEHQSKQLNQFCKYTLGLQVYHNTIHKKKDIENRIYHNTERVNKNYFPESGGRNIKRFEFINKYKEYVAYGDWCYNKPDWEFCNGQRIVIREIPSAKNLICSITDEVHVPNKSTIVVLSDRMNIFSLLGILNSRLIGFYVYAKTEKGKQKLFPRISLKSVSSLPIPKIDFSNKTQKQQHDSLVKLVEQMLEAKKQTATTDRDKQFLENKINSLDRQIDNLVYKLYDLTDEEIAIVEKS